MGKLLSYKVLIIGILMLLLLIPLTLIRGVISERTAYREQARQEIARSWTGAQKVLGPLLVIPFRESKSRNLWDENLKNYKLQSYSTDDALYLLPDELYIAASVDTEKRSRGLYSIPVYTNALHFEGTFDTNPLKKLLQRKGGSITLGDPYLSVVLSDVRGVVVQPQLTWRGKVSHFISGSGLAHLEGGIHAPVTDVDGENIGRFPFSFEMSLRGMEQIAFSPVGQTTEVKMATNWPHPSFIGRFLPEEHTIEGGGFESRWFVSSFSSDMLRIISECAQGKCQEFSANTFGVSLVNPVDIYQQTERAVKYAILFITLTFVVFFLFEMMKQLRLHPMQYLLVGAALTAFYLLLVSLSEHIAFHWAYLIAAVSSTLLITIYVSGVLASSARGMALGSGLLVLYGMLYAILRSEDNALLMGSLLIFAVVGSVMLVTRKFDWYRLGNQSIVSAADEVTG